jgi:hypothetical protein
VKVFVQLFGEVPTDAVTLYTTSMGEFVELVNVCTILG